MNLEKISEEVKQHPYFNKRELDMLNLRKLLGLPVFLDYTERYYSSSTDDCEWEGAEKGQKKVEQVFTEQQIVELLLLLPDNLSLRAFSIDSLNEDCFPGSNARDYTSASVIALNNQRLKLFHDPKNSVKPEEIKFFDINLKEKPEDKIQTPKRSLPTLRRKGHISDVWFLGQRISYRAFYDFPNSGAFVKLHWDFNRREWRASFKGHYKNGIENRKDVYIEEKASDCLLNLEECKTLLEVYKLDTGKSSIDTRSFSPTSLLKNKLTLKI
jgi:hypothetical protein